MVSSFSMFFGFSVLSFPKHHGIPRATELIPRVVPTNLSFIFGDNLNDMRYIVSHKRDMRYILVEIVRKDICFDNPGEMKWKLHLPQLSTSRS